ncbi:unnamed protein product [Angiostrongylus costaricensis]|uniref:Histone acetyltransferase n=1 Tax=Angiostrongylus costaricensis TaxID=334426 RepID=A0A158PKU1_ANGCS|nr:unnamed protein product [Angiostrongylus costaricensis]
MPILDAECVLVGETYLVRGRRGRWRNATVLDKRGTGNGSIELYMHFDGDDRRLDRWIDSSRVKVTKVKYIEVVRYGEFEIDTWYVSPYPDEYGKERYLFICDYCFLYVRQERAYKMHLSSCTVRHPPGKEIYHDTIENIVVYEVDGSKERVSVSYIIVLDVLIRKEKKTAMSLLVFRPLHFLFYLIMEILRLFYSKIPGIRPVGYFSKERNSSDGHNLNCILVFPPFQRQGYGSFLIQLSYELSRREGVNGSPEKPLSDLGLMSYRHFWAYMIVDHLMSLMDMSWIRITELANMLGMWRIQMLKLRMQVDDVIVTLKWLKLYEPSSIAETPEGIEPWIIMEEVENEEKALQNGARSVPEQQNVTAAINGSSDAVDCGGETAEGSSTETSVGAVDTARTSPRCNEEPDSRNRTFTVTGLRHPGGWRTHSEIINMLARCESFNIKFERAAKQRGPKPGCISLTFDSISSAREAFTQAQKIRIDGQAIKVEAGPCFFAPATCRSRPFFKVPSDEEVRKRTIYALDLPTSAEQSLLNSIFEADHIEKITFLPLRSQHKQAEVVMHTEEQVEAARSEDGFELDDGQQQSVLRILTPADYAAFVEQEQKPIPFVPQIIPPSAPLKPPVTCEAQPTVAPPADVKLAPVLDEDDVTDMFIKYVSAHRVNWAEITDVMELYTICDAVSSQIGGLPDSVLRPAMLHTLQRHLTEAQTAWMRDHLQFLIKGWKHEVRSETFVDRPTFVQMKAAEYVPVAPSKKRFRGKNSAQSRAGRVLMGVGALLEAQRSKHVF